MTAKISKTAADQYYAAPDNDAFTIPAPTAEWTLAFIVGFDGLTDGADTQYFLSNGPFQSAGSLSVVYQPGGVTNTSFRNKLTIYLNTSSSPTITTRSAITPGQFYLYVMQNSGTTFSIRRCPILQVEPTDASAVTAEGTQTRSAELNAPSGMFLGTRADLLANRWNDQSIGRFFYMQGLLTDMEVAQLAYGKEITDIGKSPVWYVRLNDADDFQNRGSAAVTFSKYGSPVTSPTQPAFGYTGAPSVSAPVISGTPTLSATPAEGVAVGYSPASVAGTPTPTRTQQWRIAGVDIADATGATYTPTSSDAGKSLSVRQTETNSAGTTSATSSGVVVVAAAASSVIDVAQLANLRILQRNTPTQLDITYTGPDPASIEYQLYAADGATVSVPWAALTATIGNGTATASPTFPAGGPYRIAVRSKSASGTILATSPIKANVFRAGALIGVIGSSSASKLFESASGTGFTPNAATAKMTGTAFTWGAMSTNGAATLLADRIAQQSRVPVGMLDYGVSGTTLAQWNGTGTSWANFAAAVAAAGGKLEAVYITVGSNDAENNGIASRAAHLTNMKALIARVRTLTGQPNLPVLWSGSNRRPALPAAQANFLRMAENDVGDETNVFHTQTIDFEVHTDNVHLSPNANGYPASAARAAYVLGGALYGGVYRRGPKMVRFNYSGSSATVTMEYRGGNDFVPASGASGFVASDSTGALNIVSVTRTNSAQQLITFDRSIGSNFKLTHLAGPAPDVSALIYDNVDPPLPAHVETDLVATAGAAPTTGTFTTYQLTTSGTLRVEQQCNYTWFAGGMIGVAAGAPTHGTKALTSLAVLNVSDLPIGPGFMLMQFADGGVAYQPGSVA